MVEMQSDFVRKFINILQNSGCILLYVEL